MDEIECAPKCLLGWPIKSSTQIWFNWIVPIALELFVYIVLIVADGAVTYQHFIDGNHLWAGLTLTFLYLPAILCFCSIITSPWNWPDFYPGTTTTEEIGTGASKQCLQFILVLAFNVLFFPVGSLARFGRRLFWSIEALFHDSDSYERHHSLSKAMENSTFELYHYLQAFAQAAPQLLLQLSILLHEDIFRNYDTTTVQAISIVFSLLQMAIIAESYQRFESQKIVGRNYPWHPAELCQERKELLQRRTIPPRKPQSVVTTTTTPPVTEFPDEMLGLNDDHPESMLRRGVSSSTVDEDQLPPAVVVVEVDGVRKTLHVDENNFDVQEKMMRPKSSLTKRTPSSCTDGLYDIEIDGHAAAISDRKALRADGDEIKLLQSTSSSSGGGGQQPMCSPAALEDNLQHHLNFYGGDHPHTVKGVDEPKAINVESTTKGQLSRDHDKRRRRRSYLAEDDDDENAAAAAAGLPKEDEDDDKPYDVKDYNGNDYNFDTSPTTPPPPLPSVLSPFNKILNYPLNRLSTIADMLLLDTELYVKDHVPRLPQKIARHEFKSHRATTATSSSSGGGPNNKDSTLIDEREDDDDAAAAVVVRKSMAIKVHSSGGNSALDRTIARDSATQQQQEVDEVDGNVLMMPRRRRMVVGLEQEDFFAKTVAFLGWTFFILMRVLSLSVFANLHWRAAIYICLGHYFIMLTCLLYEVKWRPKVDRLLFYFFLSYAYVFVIMEFKIKFVHLRMWYGLYVGFVLTQNFVLSVFWYVAVMDFELWWFDYLFRTILGSGVLSLCCLLVYYLRLKPKDKVLFELMEESAQEQQ